MRPSRERSELLRTAVNLGRESSAADESAAMLRAERGARPPQELDAIQQPPHRFRAPLARLGPEARTLATSRRGHQIALAARCSHHRGRAGLRGHASAPRSATISMRPRFRLAHALTTPSPEPTIRRFRAAPEPCPRASRRRYAGTPRLAQIGIVARADGARLRVDLARGAAAGVEEGDLWRSDSFTVAADAATGLARRLADRDHLAEIGADSKPCAPRYAACGPVEKAEAE